MLQLEAPVAADRWAPAVVARDPVREGRIVPARERLSRAKSESGDPFARGAYLLPYLKRPNVDRDEYASTCRALKRWNDGSSNWRAPVAAMNPSPTSSRPRAFAPRCAPG